MQLDLVAGCGAAVAALKQAFATQSMQHAVLLVGPDGCGRNFVARCLSADYLFPEGGAGAQAVMNGQSSEVLLVAGEGKSGQIPVDKIRAMRSDVFLSSLSCAGRVVHIRDAHRMAAPPANALLKVLEEPPSDVLFVLTAQSPAALPATILSRCSLYTLTPAGPALCQPLLEKALPQNADSRLPELLSALYDGRVGLGLKALASEERLAILMDALTAADAAAKRDSYRLLCLFSGYEAGADGERERREALLADLTDALSAAMRGVPAPGLPAMPHAAAALLLPLVADTRIALHGNAAPKLAFTALVAAIEQAGLASG